MAVFSALKRVPDALSRNPVLFVVFGALGLLQTPQLLAQSVSPVLASVVGIAFAGISLLVAPFVQGGSMKMADEALDGRTSLGAFVQAGKSNYLSILGVLLIMFLVGIVFWVISVVAAVFGGGMAAVGSQAGRGVGAAGMLVVLLVGLVILLGFLVLMFAIQFYGQEIVLNDAGAVDSLKQSASLVRSNLASTLGYFVLVMVVAVVLGIALTLLSVVLVGGGMMAMSSQPASTAAPTATSTPSLTGVVLYAVVNVVFTAITSSVFVVYAVSFWRELRGRNDDANATAV